jgi:hypothetical protein
MNTRGGRAVLLAALCLSACARGPDTGIGNRDAVLQATLSTNTILVGDVVRLDLAIERPKGSALQIPDLSRGKDVIVRHREQRDRALSENRIRTVVRMDLSSYVVGEHVLSTNRVVCTRSDGSTVSLPIRAGPLRVETTLAAGDREPRDIKAPQRWPGTIPRWVTGLALVAAIAALLGLAAARVLNKPRTILHFAPPPPPHEIALRALRELLARGWIEETRVEPFYVELSAILRRYLEDRFNLRAPEQTTEEFLRDAATSGTLSEPHQALARRFLEQCDLVKFARHRPGAADMKAGYRAAESLVIETTPAPEPATVEP